LNDRYNPVDTAQAKKSVKYAALPVCIRTPTPHNVLIESRIVQTATQNRSTDPQTSGARISATIVVQSWIELNVAATDRIQGIIAIKSRRSV
jgi:hypothetical protein